MKKKYNYPKENNFNRGPRKRIQNLNLKVNQKVKVKVKG